MSAQGGIGKNKTESDYNSVTNQAGIHAGKEGFDIEVGKNTDLKGAVIDSIAIADKNKISTDTLTYGDIENKAEYSADSKGMGVNTSAGAEYNEKGVTPNIGVKAEDEAKSTTKSAIAEGTVEIRSDKEKDVSGLGRDTENVLNKLGEIFDKTKVEEKQELAQVFGKEVFKAIGDLRLKVGSPEKIALDALAGGMMAKLGGDSFVFGVVGAGLNQLVENELLKIKDPALHQWASALVGAAASKIIGGKVQTGASTAVSETKHNAEEQHLITVDGIAMLGIIVIVNGQKTLVDDTGKAIAWISEKGEWIKSEIYESGSAIYDWAHNQYINATFPENPDDFNPEGLTKDSYDTSNGKVVKWKDPVTGKAKYEWDEDKKNGEHYHKIPESGKGREEHPETGDTHMKPGDAVPE